MGRKALSFDGFSRLRGSDKDKDRSKDRSGGHDDHGEAPVTPPATALSHSSSSTKNSSNLGQSTAPSTPASSIGGNQATKGTVPVPLSTPPGMVEFERKHPKSKNSSLTDLGQSLLGKFSSGYHSSSLGSAHSNDRDASPTPEKETKKLKKLREKEKDKEKEKEKEKEKDKDANGGPDRKPSKRDRFLRKMFSRRSGSDGGSGLQSTISAEDLIHGEYPLPSNSSIRSMETRDVDLRSRPSAESLASNLDISPKPKMVAREERLSLNGGRSREELRRMRSTSTGSFWPARNVMDLDEVDSDEEEMGKKDNENKEAYVEKEVVEVGKQKIVGEPKQHDQLVQAALQPPPAPTPDPAPISIPTPAPLAPIAIPASTPSPSAMEIGSPKRKAPRIMGSMESMIPVPNKSIRRVGSMSMSSLGNIISANASTTSINSTGSITSTPNKDKSRSQSISTPIKDRSLSTSTLKDRSQSPAAAPTSNSATSASPTKRTIPRPVVNLTPSKLLNQSSSANSAKSKAMKYGSLIDDANATIRPRINKARKPSAAVTEMVGGDEAMGGRARSNSLPSGKRSGYNSEESEEEGSSGEMKRGSTDGMVVDKGKQKEVVLMEPLGEIKMPMTPPPTSEELEKKTVEEKKVGEEKVEEKLEEKVKVENVNLTEPPVVVVEGEVEVTEPPVVVEEKPAEMVEITPLPVPQVLPAPSTPKEALSTEQEMAVEEPPAEKATAPRVEEPEYEVIDYPTQTTPPPEKDEVKQKEEQKSPDPEVAKKLQEERQTPEPEVKKKVQIEVKPAPEEIALPMSPTPLSPVVLPMSRITSPISPISPIQPAKDIQFPTLNKNPSLPLQASEGVHTIKKKPSLTAHDDFPTLNRKPSLVKQEINKWEKMMQETTPSSSNDDEKRRSFESNASSGWTTDDDTAPIFTEEKKNTDIVGKSIVMSEEEKAQQEKVDRVAKELHMLIDETEKEVRKHVPSSSEDEEELELGAEDGSVPTTIVPVTPDEIPTSPRVAPLPASLPASPMSIPTSPKYTVKDIPIDSLDQILGSPKALPLSPRNIPTSPKIASRNIPVDSLDRLLGSPKMLPTSPKITPISPKIIPAREVPVESLDKVLEEMETRTLESYLSPRLVPLPSTSEAEEEEKREEKEEEKEEVEAGEEQEEEEEEEEEGVVYDSDEEGSVIYRSEKVAGSVTFESSPSTSSVYEHPTHRSRGLVVLSEPEDEDEGEGTEEDEIEDIEEDEEDEEYERKPERVEVATEIQGPQVERRKVELCTIATQTDLLSPPPTPPPVKLQELTSEPTMEIAQLMMAHASNQQIHAGTEDGLSKEMKDFFRFLNVNLNKINKEEKKRERLARKASWRNISVSVESSSTGESSGSSDEGEPVVDVEKVESAVAHAEAPAATSPTPEETAMAVPASVELSPVPVEVPVPVPATTTPEPAPTPTLELALAPTSVTAPAPATITPEPTTITTTKEIQTVIRETHYITYVHTTDHFSWLKVLAFLIIVVTFLILAIAVVTQKYFDMQEQHLYECGYPPENKCLCVPKGWLGLEEPLCKCVFWPRTC